MSIPELLLAILLAALVFAATFFSAAQVVRQWRRRWLRNCHLAAVVLTIAVMAMLDWNAFLLSRITGVALFASAAGAAYLETRWNRLLPAIQIVFAAFLVFVLPLI